MKLSAGTKSGDIPILYSLRTIAALSVCLFHFTYATENFFHNQTFLSIAFYGKFGVEMFFVISGFIIPLTMFRAGYAFKNFFAFIFKRLIRLEPPYIVSIILALLIIFFRQKLFVHNTAETPSFTQIALHFGYLIPFFHKYNWLLAVYWTLAIEFQFYIFIALAFIPLVKGQIWVRLIFYALAFIAPFFFGFGFLPDVFPCFMLGILLFFRKIKHISMAEFYIVTLLLLSFCFYKYNPGAALFIMVPVICIAFFENRNSHLLKPLGNISYSVYLFHMSTGGSLIYLLDHHANTPLLKILLVLAGVALTLLSSYIMYLLVEHPSKRLSGKIKYK